MPLSARYGTWSRKALSSFAKREAAWRVIQAQALLKGFPLSSLKRLRGFLGIACGVDVPDYADPLQRPPWYFRELTARPFHDPSAFEWTKRLVEQAGEIRAECARARTQGVLDPHHHGLADRGAWDTLYFYAGGERIESTHALCPVTSAALDGISGVRTAGQAYLSVLSAGTHVEAHCGPTNTRLRCHFGIAVPEGSRIRVGREVRSWEEGECLLFDDSFEHEVWNTGDADRIVLLFDVWHPDLTEAERFGIEQIIRLSGRYRNYRGAVKRGAGR